MVAIGLVLWSVSRLPKLGERSFLGLRLVQGLNIGTIAGQPKAIAAYLLTNRLLPTGVVDRADWEVRAFFATWLAVGIYAFVRPRKSAWRDCLGAGAILFAAAVVADVLTTGQTATVGAATRGGPFLGFDAVLLVLAGLLGLACYKVGTPPKPRRARSVTQAMPALQRG